MSLPISPYLRYKASDYNNNIWYQSSDSTSSPNINIDINDPNITKTQNTIGNGVNKYFDVIQGTYNYNSSYIQINTNKILAYTMFSVARYNGSHKKTIIGSNNIDDECYYGFRDGYVGVSYQNDWITTPSNTFNSDNWVISTNYAYNYRYNGLCNVSYVITGVNYLPPIAINNTSDYQIADIIIYNRQLLLNEIIQIETHLFNLYGFNGYYFKNINLYSLYMPKLIEPSSTINPTNFSISNVDLNNIFQKKINSNSLESNYLTNITDLSNIFQSASECIFNTSECKVVSSNYTNQIVKITVKGDSLSYVKKIVCLIYNGLTTSISIYETVSNLEDKEFNIEKTLNDQLSSNAMYTYTLYLFDSNNQYYDNNKHDGYFYTYPSGTLSLVATDKQITATITGFYTSVLYSINDETNYQENNIFGNLTSGYLTPNTTYRIYAKLIGVEGLQTIINKYVNTNGIKPILRVDPVLSYNILPTIHKINLILQNPYSLTIDIGFEKSIDDDDNWIYLWDFTLNEDVIPNASLSIRTTDKNNNVFTNTIKIRHLINNFTNENPYESLIYVLISGGGMGGKGLKHGSYNTPGGGGGGGGVGIYGVIDNISITSLMSRIGNNFLSTVKDTNLDIYADDDVTGYNITVTGGEDGGLDGVSGGKNGGAVVNTKWSCNIGGHTPQTLPTEFITDAGEGGTGYGDASSGSKGGTIYNGNLNNGGGNGGQDITNNGGGGGGGGAGFIVNDINTQAKPGGGGYGGYGGYNGKGYGGGGGGGGGFGSADNNEDGALGNPGNVGYGYLISYKIT